MKEADICKLTLEGLFTVLQLSLFHIGLRKHKPETLAVHSHVQFSKATGGDQDPYTFLLTASRHPSSSPQPTSHHRQYTVLITYLILHPGEQSYPIQSIMAVCEQDWIRDRKIHI